MLDYLACVALGFWIGYASHWQQSRKGRPIRLLRHDVIAPGMPAIQSVIAEEWKGEIRSFTLWAEYVGLSEMAMVRAGVVSQRGYRRIVGVLRNSGILVAFERSRTHYAPGWCGARVRSFLRRGKLSLDLPTTPPPVVHIPVRLYPAHADLADARRRTQILNVTGNV